MMKTILTYLLFLPMPYLELWAQEPFNNVADKDALNKAYEERHYKIMVTFRVIDEQGDPVSDADIDVGIDSLLHADGYNNYRGKTDTTGFFTVESRGRGCSEVLVQKKGYYDSRPDVRWDGRLNPGGGEMHKNGGFRPWNPTIDVMIKKIGKPIPMRVWLGDRGHMAPKVGEEFGFDLYEKDWVQPHGKGGHTDLLVKFSTRFIDQNDYSTTCSIRFANPDDGFIPIPELLNAESLLKYPRIAPDKGYELKRLLVTRGATGNEARHVAATKEPMGYLLRFRSIKDEDTGKIMSAYYGKITRPQERVGNVNPFEVHSLDRVNRKLVSAPRFRFSMYLNPTPNDRNLEYDQRTNLAPEADRGLTWAP
jgi:hypothetical protein